MHKKLWFLISIFYFLLFAPFLTQAISIPYWGQNGLLACDATKVSSGFCSFCQLLQTFQNFIYFAITLVLFAFGPVLIAYGGFMILISGGSETRLDSGKKILTGTLISIFIALGSFVIINTFLWALGQAGGGSVNGVGWPNIDCGAVNNLLPEQGGTSGSAGGNRVGGGANTGANNTAFGMGGGSNFRGGGGNMGGGGASGSWATLSDSQARQDLVPGVSVKAGVSFEGIMPTTINEVNGLEKNCNCSVTITSGTEGVHDIGGKFSHINGYKVDLRLNAGLNTYIVNNFQFVGARGSDGAAQYKAPDGAIYAKEGDHWDVLVKS